MVSVPGPKALSGLPSQAISLLRGHNPCSSKRGLRINQNGGLAWRCHPPLHLALGAQVQQDAFWVGATEVTWGGALEPAQDQGAQSDKATV